MKKSEMKTVWLLKSLKRNIPLNYMCIFGCNNKSLVYIGRMLGPQSTKIGYS